MKVDFRALSKQIELMIDETASPAAAKAVFVAAAEERVNEFESAWADILKRRPDIVKKVDGREGAAFDDVRFPDGVISARVNATGDVARDALVMLNRWVKILSGELKRSLAVYRNGRRVPLGAPSGAIPDGRGQIIITYLAPYARKAEREGFNIRGGAGGALGLLETVERELKKAQNRTGAGVPVNFNFRNFSESGLKQRGKVRRVSPPGGGKKVLPLEPERLPALLIGFADT